MISVFKQDLELMKKFILFLSLLLFLDVLIHSNAYAYIDPGTGSIMLQALIAGIAAAGAAVSVYWSKIKSFFSKKEKNDKPPNN